VELKMCTLEGRVRQLVGLPPCGLSRSRFASQKRFGQLKAFGSSFLCSVLITDTSGTSGRSTTLLNGGKGNGVAVN
jgi:hypothetical protein